MTEKLKELTKEHQEMLKRHEEYEEKAKKAKVTYRTGITGEYEPFRELVCPIMTNIVHGERDIYCRGPQCGHWSSRLNMCGTATMGEMAYLLLELSKVEIHTLNVPDKIDPKEKKEEEEKLSPDIERQEEYFKNFNRYHFNFSVEIPDTLSEEEQKYISENLLGKLNGHLFDKGFHLPSIRVENEWYKDEDNALPSIESMQKAGSEIEKKMEEEE